MDIIATEIYEILSMMVSHIKESRAGGIIRPICVPDEFAFKKSFGKWCGHDIHWKSVPMEFDIFSPFWREDDDELIMIREGARAIGDTLLRIAPDPGNAIVFLPFKEEPHQITANVVDSVYNTRGPILDNIYLKGTLKPKKKVISMGSILDVQFRVCAIKDYSKYVKEQPWLT